MSLGVPGLSLALWLALAVHNVEEARAMPAWLAQWRAEPTAPRWLRRVPAVGPGEFRLAVTLLTGAWGLLAAVALWAGPRSPAALLWFGVAFAMAVNAVLPHAAASLLRRRVMPGTASGLLLNLPLGAALLHRALSDGWADGATLAWSAPLVALGLAVSIPMQFALARAWLRPRPGRQP